MQSIVSGRLTAWKRVYVEVDRMVKGGTYLTAAVPAGATQIPVISTSGFAAGNHVFVMHGPSIGSGLKTFYGQD